MSFKYGIVFSSLLFILFACSHKSQFPVKLTERVADGSVTLNQTFFPLKKFSPKDSVQREYADNELDKLVIFRNYYDERNPLFNLADFENSWNTVKIYRNNFSFEGLKLWVELSGFLLELIGGKHYAQELEESLFYSSTKLTENEFVEIKKLVTQFVYTKNVDHIHVNLFANATIKYEHTLKGSVEITQETNYSESGKIQIKFKMEKKRYIELYIRIPEWAEGATVTEWRVKYVATPGEYCQIVRKWGDGDVVEIDLPVEKMPRR